ncbi:MAG: sortase [Streptosporangiales bacterium]|nr:sortase [Streptosporangiales bacterium]
MSRARRVRRPDAGAHAHGRSGSRKAPRVLLIVAVCAAVGATTAVGLVRTGGGDSARPRASANVTEKATPQHRSSSPAVRGPVLGRAAPVELRIRTIGLRSRLLALGLRTDGTVAVPAADQIARAGWYEYSPTPGEVGPAVILGHVHRPAGQTDRPVFSRLETLRRGDLVEVVRADEVVAVFRVDRVERYPAEHFPAREVYGAADHAALRLITCTAPGTTPAPDERNVVVYASLVTSRTVG